MKDYWQIMEWISVKDRLPTESDGTVLVCMPNKYPYNEREPFIGARHDRRVRMAIYSQYSGTWHFSFGAVGRTAPEYWMPLPEPPKGGIKDD